MSGGPWEDFKPAETADGPWKDFAPSVGVTPAPANAKPREQAPQDPAPESTPNFLSRTAARISAAEKGTPLPSHTSPPADYRQASRFADRAFSLQPIRAAVQLPEFATTEMVGMIGTTVATAAAKAWAMGNGYSREGADSFAEEVGAEHSKTVGAAYRPLTTIINAIAGQGEPTTLDRLMGKVTDAIKGGAEGVSEATGGAITSGEAHLLVNAIFSRFAAKGLNKMTARWDGKGPMPKAMAKQFEEAMAAQGKPPTSLHKASPSDIMSAFEKEEVPAPKASESFKKKYPTLKKAGMVDEYGKPLAAAAGVGVAAYALSNGDEDSASLAMAAAIPFSKRIDALREVVPKGDPFRARLEEVATAGPSAIQKIDSLRMDLADRGAPKETLALIDAAARDLEVMLEPQGAPMIWWGGGPELLSLVVRNKDNDAAKAMGFLTIGALAKLPDATPLGAIHGRLRYTSRFLERLNERSAGTWDFSVKQLRQELGKSGAPTAERAIFEKIIEGRERVTAKELVGGFKAATGDFELRADTTTGTGRYEPYGLERIDRLTDAEVSQAAGNEVRLEQLRAAIDQASQARVNSDGTRTIQQFGGLRRVRLEDLEAEYAALEGTISKESAGPLARTTVWRSPIATGTSNHFSDPNYFAHTRSFDEGGIRHVVEVQSDLVQKAGKVLTPEAEAALRKELEARQGKVRDLTDQMEAEQEALGAAMDRARQLGQDASGPMWRAAMERRNDAVGRLTPQIREARLRVQEAERDIRAHEQGKSADALRLLFPDWYKRIVREEIADAARAAQGDAPRTLRFATADTVAKVEGWPEQYGEAVRSARNFVSILEEDIRRASGPNPRWWPVGEETLPQYLSRQQARLVEAQQLLAELEANESANKPNAPRFSPRDQRIYDRYRNGVEKFLRTEYRAREYTDPSGHTWLEIDLPSKEPQTRLFGAAVGAGLGAALWFNAGDDKEALAALAVAPVAKGRAAKIAPAILAIGGGAALAAALSSPENQLRNASLTAAIIGIGAFAKSRSTRVARWAEGAGEALEVVYGNLSAELRTISQPLLRKLTGHEINLKVREHDALKKITPFAEGALDLPTNVREAVDIALMSGKRATALAILDAAGKPELAKSLQSAFSYIDEVGGELRALGLVKRLNPGHFPRIVTDLDGLMQYLGKEASNYLVDKLKEAALKKVQRTGAPLNDIEMSAIVNEHLVRAINLGDFGGQSGVLKKRTIGQMHEGLLPFYATAADSIVIYARAASREIERARFFGANLVKAKDTLAVNVDRSIGKVVDQERRAGNLSHEQLDRLESLMRARFGPGEKSGHWVTQTYRNIVQTLLLGNPFSAMVQFGDAAIAVAIHGLIPTIRGVASTVLGKNTWRLEDFGLVNHITEDLVRTTRRDTVRVGGIELSSGKFLDKTLKLSLFSFVDEFSKMVNMNAAAAKFTKLARSEGGRNKIALQYGDYFGADLPQLVADLKAGRKTPLVGELIFRELSDVQPISKLEMPQGYLASPHTRVLYTLKSFMIKQMNLVRERGFREIAKGDAASIARGTNFLLRYSLALGISGASLTAIANWLMGKKSDIESSDVVENVFKSFGWSGYAIDKARKGHAVEAAVEGNFPPYKLFDDIASTPDELRKWAAGDPKANPKGVQYIPLVGKLIYNRALGGAERANKRDEQIKERKQRESEKLN